MTLWAKCRLQDRKSNKAIAFFQKKTDLPIAQLKKRRNFAPQLKQTPLFGIVINNAARSSRGQDTRFSFLEQGFDSPTGYY